MGWIEVIRLRVPLREREEALGKLGPFLRDCDRAPDGPSRVWILVGLQPAGDIALALSWPSEAPLAGSSGLALAILKDLKKYGLVNTSIWVPWAFSPEPGPTIGRGEKE